MLRAGERHGKFTKSSTDDRQELLTGREERSDVPCQAITTQVDRAAIGYDGE